MKSVTHLTDAGYRGLLEGSLAPDEAERLARHLEADCAECEGFLGSREAADGLDGQVDQILAAFTPATARRGDDQELARIERRLRNMEGPPRRSRRAVPVPMVAAAAGILAAGVAGVVASRWEPRRPVWNGEKGVAARATVPVRLRILVLKAGGRGVELQKGVSGQTVSASSSLAFEIETGRAADVWIGRIPRRGAPDFFWHRHVGAGRVQVTVGELPAAYPLADSLGTQRFVAIASEARLDAEQLATVAAGLAPPARIAADVPGLDGLSYDAVDVEVR